MPSTEKNDCNTYIKGSSPRKPEETGGQRGFPGESRAQRSVSPGKKSYSLAEMFCERYGERDACMNVPHELIAQLVARWKMIC